MPGSGKISLPGREFTLVCIVEISLNSRAKHLRFFALFAVFTVLSLP